MREYGPRMYWKRHKLASMPIGECRVGVSFAISFNYKVSLLASANGLGEPGGNTGGHYEV